MSHPAFSQATHRHAQIWAVLAASVCLSFAGFALYGMHFVIQELDVPLSTMIEAGSGSNNSSGEGWGAAATTTMNGYHDITFAGLLALRFLALCNGLSAVLTSASVALLPLRKKTNPDTVTNAAATTGDNDNDDHSTRATVAFPTNTDPGNERQQHSTTTPRRSNRSPHVSLLALAVLTFLLSALYIIASVLYLLNNPAMQQPWLSLPRYFRRRPGQEGTATTTWCSDADNSGSSSREGQAFLRNLQLATGFWFRGDVAAACIGIISAGVVVRSEVLRRLDAGGGRGAGGGWLTSSSSSGSRRERW
ncbi:hypothetical protein Micbo1qcDRAFT_205611 [Microdochium bolleyi]|uniref:Uncharacterized protein n=1 Tax=Microdochium bolleyi TaxID=196109 RepID=A0A136IYK2_9PEZI|nr:hypothetical protein Micbo1qcDRAFT_205611 [Microdochium bolleyi]